MNISLYDIRQGYRINRQIDRAVPMGSNCVVQHHISPAPTALVKLYVLCTVHGVPFLTCFK